MPDNDKVSPNSPPLVTSYDPNIPAFPKTASGDAPAAPAASATDDSRPQSLVSDSPVSQANPQHQTDPEGVVTAPHAPKKYGGKKIIATIFGILLLIGGVAAGVGLVQRVQEIRERAASGRECSQSPDCILLDEPGNSGNFTAPRTITHVFITDRDVYRYEPGETDDGCRRVRILDNFISWEKYGPGPECKDVSNVQIWLGSSQPTNTPTPTPSDFPSATITPTSQLSPSASPTNTPSPTLPPGTTARCGNVKAYDSEWNLLSGNDLASLKPGDVVRFAVSGTASSGTFDKAKFTINGVTRSEVTNQKPGSDEFYDEYAIPASVTTFTVSAQVHHTELGWF